jgi:hypothetical protein
MKRHPHALWPLLLALGLAIVSPILAGAMAWGFVDQAKRTGALYEWFFVLPGTLCRLIFRDQTPGWLVLSTAFFLQYVSFGLLLFVTLAFAKGRKP